MHSGHDLRRGCTFLPACEETDYALTEQDIPQFPGIRLLCDRTGNPVLRLPDGIFQEPQ